MLGCPILTFLLVVAGIQVVNAVKRDRTHFTHLHRPQTAILGSADSGEAVGKELR